MRDGTKVITGKVRFSYVHVFEPTSMDEDQPKKYSSAILIPKTDKATVKEIKEAIQVALDLGINKHFGGKTPTVWTNPLRDGDEEKPDDEVYAGHYFLNAKSVRRPGVINALKEPITDKDEFYSGCYGRASINFFAYSKPKKGVAVGLNNVIKLADGDNLGGGGSSAQDDFADIEIDDLD